MIEVIFGLGMFILIAGAILAVVWVIPRWVILSTESEVDINHIYNIFWEEAGFRGHKIISPAGVLFPFIELSKSSNELIGLIFVSVVCIACLIYHLSVYKNYPVLNSKMKLVLVMGLGLLVALSMLARFNIINSSFVLFAIMFCGVGWGAYAVYRRSGLVRIKRLSS
ncbi:hypothetical protein [Simiduia aestuariiviva]|uniref:Uncharacterized protein n=1 Tax=Simiduia aestuariiviva TaxID=1510459 RepID=A0A839UUC6_9GAMM|nr:hypothetical protein [Simiduia aestuariiviva]MBB3169576.1 hypothetical protein [Simiduia aestuariiviva]